MNKTFTSSLLIVSLYTIIPIIFPVSDRKLAYKASSLLTFQPLNFSSWIENTPLETVSLKALTYIVFPFPTSYSNAAVRRAVQKHCFKNTDHKAPLRSYIWKVRSIKRSSNVCLVDQIDSMLCGLFPSQKGIFTLSLPILFRLRNGSPLSRKSFIEWAQMKFGMTIGLLE